MGRLTGFLALAVVVGVPFGQLRADEPKKKADEESSKLIVRLNDTGLRIAASLLSKERNLIYYPASANPVISTFANGASGENLKELRRNTGWAGFDNTDALSRIFRLQRDGEFKLKSANALWSKSNLKKEWIDQVQKETGAKVIEIKNQTPADLAKDVNKWFETNTNGEIKDLVKASDLERAVFASVNATFVQGQWKFSFDKDGTKPMDFNRLDGTKVQAQMMSGKGHFAGFRLGSDATCVLMPVKGDVVFGAVLPDEGKYVESFALIKQGLIDDLKTSIAEAEENKAPFWLEFPKFKIRSDKMDLIPGMKKMGIERAFKGGPDEGGRLAFEKITGEDIYIQKLAQEAVLEVDEKGFRGTSGTVGIAVPRGGSIKHAKFDRPFHYFVVDLTNGQLLLVGSVVDPTKETPSTK
jgi:serine protease inhibitor